MTKVFLSSTFVDLETYRKVAIEVCKRLGLDPIGMEYFNAQSAGATEGCKHEMDKADLYVGFYAHRYGYIEDCYTVSVTETEFDYAGERGLDRLCFIVDPKHPWPPEHTDHQNYPKLEKFKNEKVNKLIRGQFTNEDNFGRLLDAALVEWLGGFKGRASGGSSAIHATHPDDFTEKPDILFGRDQLLTDVRALLDDHQRVLLQGFGGMGKTALAATLAAHWIKDGKGNVLWHKAGNAEVDDLFEALARPFNAQQAIASQTGDAKSKALRDLLRGKATLLILDDSWNSHALFDLLKAVPSDMALLVTSRLRYPLPKIRSVEELATSDALALLSYHADRDLASAPQAVDLCDLLGNHAFAIEIAGKTLKVHNWTPVDLTVQIRDTPHKLTMPLELSQAGRENVANLLEFSLNTLDDTTRKVFLAFGAFFAPQLTPEMLMLYFVNTPEVSDNQLAKVRKDNPHISADVPDEELRRQYQRFLLNNISPEPAQKALDNLNLQGLVERLPATDISIAAYRVHDLAYSYAQAQATHNQRQQSLQACINYTEHYKKPSISNFAALRPELENLLNAVDWAFENKDYAKVEMFVENLHDRSKFLDYQGFLNVSVRLLQQAAQGAEQMGNRYKQAANLTNLGTTFKNLGQADTSIKYHKHALAIVSEIDSKHAEAYILGNLGIAYHDLGQLDTAIDYHQQVLLIVRKIGDKKAEGNVLGNLGAAYNHLGKWEIAIKYYQQQLKIVREISDKRGEGNALSGLGNAYRDLNQVSIAIDYYERANTIRHEIGDLMGEANDYLNIGVLYSVQLKDYSHALDYYQMALAIYTEIGAQHLVSRTNSNIAIVQAKMNDANSDPPDSSV